MGEPASVFAEDLGRDFDGVKLAYSPDLGELPVDPQVTEAIEKPLSAFSDLGCHLELAAPDFRDAYEIFQTCAPGPSS